MIILAYAFALWLAVWSYQETVKKRKRSRHTKGARPLRTVATGQVIPSPATTAPAAKAAKDQTHKDVVSALCNLGFSRSASGSAANRQAGSFEDRLKGALTLLKAAKQ